MKYRPSKSTIKLLKDASRKQRDPLSSPKGPMGASWASQWLSIVHPEARVPFFPGLYRGRVSRLNSSDLTFEDGGACWIFEAGERALAIDWPYLGLRGGDRDGLATFVVQNCCGDEAESDCSGSSCPESCPPVTSGDYSSDVSGGSGSNSGGSSSSSTGGGSSCPYTDYICITIGGCLGTSSHFLIRSGDGWYRILPGGWSVYIRPAGGEEGFGLWTMSFYGPMTSSGQMYAHYRAGSFNPCTGDGTWLLNPGFKHRCQGCTYPSTITSVGGNCESSSSSSSSTSSTSSSSSEESSSSSEESSSSSSSSAVSSSSSSESECSCPTETWCFVVEGVTGTCGGNPCSRFDGVYVLNRSGDNCYWNTTTGGNGSQEAALDFTLGNTLSLTIGNGICNAAYTGTGDCTETTVLSFVDSFGACATWPEEITVYPNGDCEIGGSSEGSSSSSEGSSASDPSDSSEVSAP